MTETTTFQEDAKKWTDGRASALVAFGSLMGTLNEHGGETLEEWREVEPGTYADAVVAADLLGFEWPTTDDDVDDVGDALSEWTYEQGYGVSVLQVVKVELMGGGPAGWLEFTYSDGELIRGEVAYNDWFEAPYRRALNEDELSGAEMLYQPGLSVGVE